MGTLSILEGVKAKARIDSSLKMYVSVASPSRESILWIAL